MVLKFQELATLSAIEQRRGFSCFRSCKQGETKMAINSAVHVFLALFALAVIAAAG